MRNRSSWLAVVLSLSMAFSPALAMASEATENQPDDQIIAGMLNEAGDQMPEGASDEEDGIGEGSGTEGTAGDGQTTDGELTDDQQPAGDVTPTDGDGTGDEATTDEPTGDESDEKLIEQIADLFRTIRQITFIHRIG